jgi:hypothetical protein
MQILLRTASSSAGVAFPPTLLHTLRKAEADDGDGDPQLSWSAAPAAESSTLLTGGFLR